MHVTLLVVVLVALNLGKLRQSVTSSEKCSCGFSNSFEVMPHLVITEHHLLEAFAYIDDYNIYA